MKICSFCGAENLDEAHFCTECGQGFPKPGEAPLVGATASGTSTPSVDPPAGNEVTEESPKEERLEGERLEGEPSEGNGGGNEVPKAEEKEENVPPPRSRSGDWTDFCERFVPERMRNEIYSLTAYLWFCAILNFFFGILLISLFITSHPLKTDPRGDRRSYNKCQTTVS